MVGFPRSGGACLRGQDEVIGFYRNLFDTFQAIVLEPERFIQSGDSVVVPNSARVRGRDGIETVARSALAFEVRGGRLARVRLYQETGEALAAIGGCRVKPARTGGRQ